MPDTQRTPSDIATLYIRVPVGLKEGLEFAAKAHRQPSLNEFLNVYLAGICAANGIELRRSYRVKTAAEMLEVHVNTLGRWIKESPEVEIEARGQRGQRIPHESLMALKKKFQPKS